MFYRGSSTNSGKSAGLQDSIKNIPAVDDVVELHAYSTQASWERQVDWLDCGTQNTIAFSFWLAWSVFPLVYENQLKDWPGRTQIYFHTHEVNRGPWYETMPTGM